MPDISEKLLLAIRSKRARNNGASARSKVPPQRLNSGVAIAMKFSNSAPRGCSQVAPQLTALFDGEADDAQTREARAHLLVCPDCSRQWLDWTRYRDTFQSEPAPLVPPTLLWRVLIATRVTAFARPARRRSRLPQVSAAPLRGIEAPLPPRLSQHILARTTRKSSAHVMLTPLHSAPSARPARRKNRAFKFDSTSFRAAPLWAAPALALWILMLGRADFTATLPVATPDSAIDIAPAPQKLRAPAQTKKGDATLKRPISAPIPTISISPNRLPLATAATPTERSSERSSERGTTDAAARRPAVPMARTVAPVARAIAVGANERARPNLNRVFLLAMNAEQNDLARTRTAPRAVSQAAPIAAPTAIVAAPAAAAPAAPAAPLAKTASRPPRAARFERAEVASSRVALASLASPVSPIRTLSSARLRSASFSDDSMRPRVAHLSANGRRLARLAPDDDATTLRVSRPIAQAPTLREVSFGGADNGPKLDELRSAVDDFRASVADGE